MYTTINEKKTIAFVVYVYLSMSTVEVIEQELITLPLLKIIQNWIRILYVL